MRDHSRLRIFTWHVHGAYLYYLSQVPHDFYVPVMEGRPEGYGGRAGTLPWPDNLHEVPAEQARELDLDCVLFQSSKNYLTDQHQILSETQRGLPRIYLEHDPPQESLTNTRHIVDDPEVLLVHVTHFNDLMWDSGRTPTLVIDHGVMVPEHLRFSGKLDRGISVVNGLPKRGRRLGLDVFERVRQSVDIDLVGMQSEALGGLGERTSADLFELEKDYRFHFSPIRYTSLGLAICEAMMLGLPVVGLATTELTTVIENGRNGYVDTSIDRLIDCMRDLQRDPTEARRLGDAARETAMERFGIGRFVRDWNEALAMVTGTKSGQFEASGRVTFS